MSYSADEPEGTVLMQWVVYDHPADYPNHFVARCWEIGDFGFRPTHDVQLAGSLEEIRQLLPVGLVCLARHPNDDPAIVEVWL